MHVAKANFGEADRVGRVRARAQELDLKSVNRPLRCCQPRDLLLQIRNFCFYNNHPPELTNEYFDQAAENYFAVM